MGLNKKIFILMALVLLLTPCLASSGEHRVSPTGSTHDQNVINDAINAASASGGGTVYLAAGVYLVDGPVIIKSNITLTGDPDAIIRVAPTKNQWFQGQIGVVCNPNEAIQNVEIHGFQIDGNIKNLDRWLDSTPEHDRDCEKLILIGGWSSNMGSNISIHDMKLYDAFSDGIYIRFTDGVYLYDNTISNCQHEGFYLSACRYGLIILNQIAGITSDCGRLDNCQEFLIKSNLFFSYDGNSYGAYKHGENGLQIGNQGAASHGYTPTKKPFTTLNIEVTNNTFADPGLRAIWLSGGGQNVYVHDNQFKDASVLETMGIKVGDISFNNTTSIGTSEKVLGGLSRFFHIKFFDSGRTNQSAENIRMKIEERDNGKISAGVAIAGFKDVVYKDGVPYIPDSNSILVKSVAIPSPGFGFRVTGDLKKEIKTEIRDGKAYASLTITMNYFKESRNSKGATVKKLYSTKEVFEAEPVPAPQILPRPDKLKLRIDQYIGGVNNYTVVTPSTDSEGLQRLEYIYDGKPLKHVFEVGEQIPDDKGVIHTNLTEVNYWDGDLDHSGEGAYIEGSDFDQAKLKIRAYTIYEEIPTETEYELHEYHPQRLLNYDNIIALLKIVVVLFAIFQLLKMIF